MQVVTPLVPIMTDLTHHPDTLANRLAQLETSTPPRSSSPSSPSSPASKGPSFAGGGVLENGTNTGSTAGRKGSLPGRSSFSMEKGVSGSGSRSRRGSGVVLTPSGTQVVYHTRTHVSDSLHLGRHHMKSEAEYLVS